MKKIKGRTRDRSTWILILVIAVFLFSSLFLLIFWVYGPISHPGAFKYEITVTGLSGITGDGSPRIGIPLPVKTDNTPVFQEHDINNRTFGIWTSRLVMAGEGTMIQFSTSEENVTDIHAVFYREEEGEMNRYRDLAEKMSPDIRNASTPYTRWMYNKTVQESPVTLVVIDPGQEPRAESPNLTFDLEFYAGGGTVSSQERDWYRLSVVEDIPADLTGSIPVRVQIGKHVNNRWIPFQ